MTLKHAEEYRQPEISQSLVRRIRSASRRDIRLMEVCGTHTMSIFRNGIRTVLPETVTLISGPGCPVCVTAQGEIDAFIEAARTEDVIVATFGDLMRVPGTGSSLERERAAGRDVRVVYSAADAVEIARKHPDRKVVFPGVGFETTAPTVAASVLSAAAEGLKNFLVFTAHKRVVPALFALMEMQAVRIDGFILPGHVSVVIGTGAYQPLFEKYRLPGVVAGFEPADILQAVYRLVSQIESGAPGLENAYPRAVTWAGNPKAVQIMETVFRPADAVWRGMGQIPRSGLKFRSRFEDFDARKVLGIRSAAAEAPKGCACGQIITGVLTPPECPLYKKRCTPLNPVGPCMVSSEGTCAAYYRYHSFS
ncbi:hydrogenase formation protein HypD [Desulfonema ishimotonii]|uniref:Hydrogenase formation protein HypD n=1 Tax=Desulfonema ishimotonii TaxID=45657 RepID=A0A401G246_9BACT|nr:hydrogenase formation protein HypD [Desulfonema ishimotonii]GBC63299.1 hydrogenase formation protein HypD [Desulfonema ishimotonii]